MSFWKQLFASKEPQTPATEQAVLVYFQYDNPTLEALFALEHRLKTAIEAANAGEYDGHEVALDGSDSTLFMYGPDADSLFAVVRPVLEATAFMRGACVCLRYGSAGDSVKEHEVTLHSQ